MNTQALPYAVSTAQSIADFRELNIYDSGFLLNSIENKLAFLEGGSNALAMKSFRSARFSLLKQLAGAKPLRVLSYEAKSSWHEDIQVYNRFHITILYADQFSEDALPEIIKSEKIDLVYIATIHSGTLAVNNHSILIHQAHSLNKLVIYDNTAGGLGSIYRPLVQEADYSIVDTSSFLGESGIGAFITEGLPKIQSPKSAFEILKESSLQILKKKRKYIRKGQLLIAGDEQSFEKRLFQEVQKHVSFANHAFTLAKWLNQVEQVMEVTYPGLKSSSSFFNAENHLRGGYGVILKFKLWESGFNHNLLRSFLVGGKNEGVNVTVDNDNKEFKIEIRTESIKGVLTYFERVFSQLNKEVEFRNLLKKQLKWEKAIQDLLQRNILLS